MKKYIVLTSRIGKKIYIFVDHIVSLDMGYNDDTKWTRIATTACYDSVKEVKETQEEILNLISKA